MTEEKFWRTTPRKFFSLLKEHNKLNSFDEAEKEQQQIKPMTLEELRRMSR